MNEPNENVTEPKMEGQETKPSWFVPVLIVVTLIGLVIFSNIWLLRKKNIRIAKSLMCGINLSKLQEAMWMYRDDFGEHPTPDKWCDLLLEHTDISEDTFKCPGNKKQRCSYALNPNAEPNAPGNLVLLFETKGGWNKVGGVGLLANDNHMDYDGHHIGANVLFNDGHVTFEKAGNIDDMEWVWRNYRRPISNEDKEYWLENMIVYHQFSNEEIIAATGYSNAEIKRAMTIPLNTAKTGFDVRAKNRPKRPADAPILVKPYPGGRHPRIGFLDGAIDPQRETKFSVFTPWDANSYVVADVPEAIWSNLGLTYLAHTHIDTIWTSQGIELEKLEWNRHPDGSLDIERTLPNGIAFGVKVKPTKEAVLMEMWLHNGTAEKLTDLRIQNCVMTKMAEGFNQQTNENKVLKNPYAACKSSDGKRWIITAWEGCHRPWANDKCPCFHSDPKFPDLEPGQKETLKGWLSFYEGEDIEGEFARIEATGWRQE